nr:UrcA family protein [uncultured Sphingomonas sp.]
MTSRLQSSGIAALSFTISAGVLALALTPATASAAATGNSEEVEFTVTGERLVGTKRVATSDLDLTDSADLKRLDSRIRGAIGQVCAEHGDGRITPSENRCRFEARRSTDQQVAALLRSESLAAAAGVPVAASTITVVASR